jgi:hypothetical protein
LYLFSSIKPHGLFSRKPSHVPRSMGNWALQSPTVAKLASLNVKISRNVAIGWIDLLRDFIMGQNNFIK